MKFCKQCQILLKKAENIFCNSSCAATYNNAFRAKSHPCLSCGGPIFRRGGKIYCGNKCQQDYAWKLKKEEIQKLGECNSKVHAKKYLRELQGSKCLMCNFDKWLGEDILLILDHIDGNPENWKIDNLRLICSNCDATTPTYKGRNKGSGRYYRRVLYKEGRSY